MKKAVFLDRDGVLNREVDNLRRLSQLRLLPGVPEALKKIRALGYLAIVVTNQPVVARGWLSEAGLKEVHDVLEKRLRRKGAVLDAIYYCPHHPNANLRKYRKTCSCRKSNLGLLRAATKKFHIDLKRSFMVGDSTRDIETGRRAEMRTILVQTGYAGKDGKFGVKPDFVARSLIAAAAIIRKHGK
jgi:D,D-heptose 1,7-bisphosphate phosphatase